MQSLVNSRFARNSTSQAGGAARVYILNPIRSALVPLFHTQNLLTLISTGLQPGGTGRECGTAVSTAFQDEAQTVETVPDNKRRFHTGLKPGVNGSLFARYEIGRLGLAMLVVSGLITQEAPAASFSNATP